MRRLHFAAYHPRSFVFGIQSCAEENWKTGNYDWANFSTKIWTPCTASLHTCSWYFWERTVWPGPVSVIDSSLRTEELLHTFNRIDRVITEVFVSSGQIISAEHRLLDVNSLRAASQPSSFEETFYDPAVESYLSHVLLPQMGAPSLRKLFYRTSKVWCWN